MTKRDNYDLMIRLFLPIVGGGLYYLVGHSFFNYPDALKNGLIITSVSFVGLMSQYIWKRVRRG
jgi:hypothetical protein